MISLNDTISVSFGLVGIVSYALGILDIANLSAFIVYLFLVFKITFWLQCDGKLDVPGTSIIMSHPIFSLIQIIINPLVYLPTYAVAIFLYSRFLSPYFAE